MQPIRVLLADPQPVARIGTRQVLEHESDIEVVGEAATGEEALRLVDEAQPRVMILDVRLPEGVEVVQRITERAPGVAVLILTSRDGKRDVKTMLDLGVAGYLLKSSTPEHIRQAVRGIARGEAGWYDRRVCEQIASLRRTEHLLEALRLTPPDIVLLEVLAKGLSNEEIAAKLHLAPGTVKNRLTRLYEKLGVKSRAEAIAWACLNEIV